VWFLFSKGYGLVEGREEEKEGLEGSVGSLYLQGV